MLKLRFCKYYQVKSGQTLAEVAKNFSISPYILAQENGLTEELYEGQILLIPTQSGNSYVVKERDTKALLCGGEKGYKEKNGTDVFYIGMRVIL